jgi:hypothetical protein
LPRGETWMFTVAPAIDTDEAKARTVSEARLRKNRMKVLV